jgi:sRNA-binding protein
MPRKKSVGRPKGKCHKRSSTRHSTKPRCKSTKSSKRKSSKRTSTKKPKTKTTKTSKKTSKKPKTKTPKTKTQTTPATRAAELDEGTKRKGRDGHMYKVMLRADGIHVWKKCGDKVNCRYSKLIGPQMPRLEDLSTN